MNTNAKQLENSHFQNNIGQRVTEWYAKTQAIPFLPTPFPKWYFHSRIVHGNRRSVENHAICRSFHWLQFKYGDSGCQIRIYFRIYIGHTEHFFSLAFSSVNGIIIICILTIFFFIKLMFVLSSRYMFSLFYLLARGVAAVRQAYTGNINFSHRYNQYSIWIIWDEKQQYSPQLNAKNWAPYRTHSLPIIKVARARVDVGNE